MEDVYGLALPEPKAKPKFSRRAVIIGGVAAAGGLALGWVFTPISTLPRARRIAGEVGETMLLTWLRIGKDDSVNVIVPHMDFGQGSQTSLGMMLAEELDADWSRVRIEEAPADSAFANGAIVRMIADLFLSKPLPQLLNAPFHGISDKVAQAIGLQLTAGSSAIRASGVHLMRPTGAAARWMLRHAAAQAWNVPFEEVETRESVLLHPASHRSARYGEMAEAAARFDPPDPDYLPLKPKSAYRIVGKTQPRHDLPPKVDGTTLYPFDLRLPGMLFGAVRQSPVIGAPLVSVDPAPALKMPGVSKVVKGKDVIVVIANNTWRARNAAAALDPHWDVAKLDVSHTSSAQVIEKMAHAVRGTKFSTDHKVGDADAALASSAKKIEAEYRVPYLAHAQMAPFASVAKFKDGELELWVSSQNPLAARHEAAKHAGLSIEQVKLHNMKMGGGFGRGSTHDYIMHAVDAAKESEGVPVQVSWAREQDMTHDTYRQASVAKLEGAVDDKGRMVAFRNSYTESRDLAESSAILYHVPNIHVRHVNGLNPLRWGFLRSVDSGVQAFFAESFIDELAYAARQDPLAFRMAHCDERAKAVLERVAQISNWGDPPPAGRARGVAIKEMYDSLVAQVAEVSVGDDGRVRVHTMYTAFDPGLVVNPGNLTAQVEGAVNFGLSATLFGQVTFENGMVKEQNFPQYDIVRMADAPHQVVSFLELGSRVGGGGEPGTPGVAPAVCNAVFALTGTRIRELPLRQFDLRTGARFART